MSATQSKCSEQSNGRSSEGRGFMLFGVRLMMEEGSFRKSASMTNLAQYDHQPQDSNNDAAGYASDDVVHPSGRSRERKRGVPWSEEEHRLFLLGLQRVGKGDWRGISRNYVKTRTPTQVASHAQKYFLRRNNHNRRRRRSSLFDITTDTVATPANEDQMHQESPPQPPIVPRQNLTRNPAPTFPVAVTPLSLPIPIENPMEEDLALGQLNQLTNSPRPLRPIPILPIPPPPPSSKMANLNLNNTTTLEPPSLSLNLSVSSLSQSPPQSEELPSTNQHSPREHHPPPPFQAMPASFSGSGGDSIISVA